MQEDPVTKPRPCVAPVLDVEELFDNEDVVLSRLGGLLLVPKTSLKRRRHCDCKEELVAIFFV